MKHGSAPVFIEQNRPKTMRKNSKKLLKLRSTIVINKPEELDMHNQRVENLPMKGNIGLWIFLEEYEKYQNRLIPRQISKRVVFDESADSQR